MKKVYAVQDEEGHWYVIPFQLKDDFFKDEETGKEDDFAYFEDKYGQYRTGGDLNNVQLYAEI